MSVAVLSLSGLSGTEAKQAAAALLDIDSGGPDRLERLLVIDDTTRLGEHSDVYEQIDTAHRVEKLLCVTVGPRSGDGRRLELPGNLGGVQGSPVLWVSRPAGIDSMVVKGDSTQSINPHSPVQYYNDRPWVNIHAPSPTDIRLKGVQALLQGSKQPGKRNLHVQAISSQLLLGG